MDNLLDETLAGRNEPISAGLLSRKCAVPIEDARKAMESYFRASNSPLSASFVVSGMGTDRVGKRAPVFRIVADSQVEDVKKELSEPVNVDIYSLSPNNAADSAILSQLAHELRELDTRASVDELKSVGYLVNPVVTSVVSPPAVKNEHKEEIKPKEELKPVPTKPKVEIKPARKEVVEKKPVAQAAAKSAVKPVAKSKSPFAQVSKEQAMSKAFDRRPNQTAAAEKVVIADDVDEDGDDAMEIDNESEQQRKKLLTLFDEQDVIDVIESEKESELESEPSPEPSPEPEPEVASETKQSPPQESRRGRKKVTKRQHFEDADGNLVTTTEEVWVSCDEDESTPEPAPKPVAKPPVKMSGPLPKIPKRGSQQATLMNFFSRKS